ISVTRMRSAGFALERSAIIVTGSTMITLPPCSICTLAWPRAVIVMAPPGASTVVVVGIWAYPTAAINTTNNATLHRSFIKSPFAATRPDYTPRQQRRNRYGRPRKRSAQAALACRVAERRDGRHTYDSRSEAGVCVRRGRLRGVSGRRDRSAGTDRP